MKRVREVLFNETGQMSIFVALIFQVLFVFFAMVINIGLVVHDKINLQNAVDLAAYYGAQRQAEILNEIAHVNYQIRQDNKLLAWRYRVLATLGRTNEPGSSTEFIPPQRRDASDINEREWKDPGNPDYPPVACVSNEFWIEFVKGSGSQENICHKIYGTTIPAIPAVIRIAPFVPGVNQSQQYTRYAQQMQGLANEIAGVANWAMTMHFFLGYKMSIAAKKMAISRHRLNLIGENFVDLEMKPVAEGARKTLLNNLTQANAASFDEGEFRLINGMSHSSCNIGDGGEFILPEVRTAPIFYYLNAREGYHSVQLTSNLDDLNQEQLRRADPSGTLQSLSAGEPNPRSPFHSSHGFEKNPWCMAYVGVRARTRPRKPFAPFGQPVSLEARAFAQPFGGRVGPWHKERWTRGAAYSDQGEAIDLLATPRLVPGGTALEEGDRLPNYSRFPGDKLGLKSELAMGAQSHIFKGMDDKPLEQRLSFSWYTTFSNLFTSGQALAPGSGGTASLVRSAEIAAVAPDLFDATYYSIDPSYYLAYVQPFPQHYQDISPIEGQQVNPMPDLGGGFGEGADRGFNIEGQISTAIFGNGLNPELLSKIFYAVRRWEHLLTAWAPHRAQNFQFPTERYGQCQNAAADGLMIPGKCVVGGRTGYSVRLISRKHLLGSEWKIGGDGEANGSILNPPDTNF